MKATILAVAAAIGLCRPALAPKPRLAYAAVVVDGAAEAGVDPLLVVALVDHESRWVPTAVSKDGEDWGLGQARRRFIPKAEWKFLLDGEHNLRLTIRALSWWRKTCKAKMGSVSAVSVLEGYAGRSRPKEGTWCGAGLRPLQSTRWILARREALAKTSP